MLDMKPAPDGVQTEITFASGEAELSGTLFLPPAATEVPPRAAVVLNSATAIPQGYYRHFAAWLAREQGIAVLPRGGGTSQCGQTVNHAIVLDTTKYLNKIIELDVENRQCVVEPGLSLIHI